MSPSTWRQQEKQLIQCLPEFYLAQLGHTPGRINCQVSDSQIVITIEEALTQLEKLLTTNSQTSLVSDLRASLDQVLRRKLKTWIAELFQTEIIDLLINTDITQDRMMAIAILPNSLELELSDRPGST